MATIWPKKDRQSALVILIYAIIGFLLVLLDFSSRFHEAIGPKTAGMVVVAGEADTKPEKVLRREDLNRLIRDRFRGEIRL